MKKNRTVYSYDEVLSHCMEYFSGDELASTTWINKYCLKETNEKLFERNPDDMHHRLASEFIKTEEKMSKKIPTKDRRKLSGYGRKRKPLTEDRIYDYFKNFGYLVPQGSIMSSLGDEVRTSSLSNCIVVESPFDSYGGISYSDQQLAQLMKRRCGVGIDISTLRPEGRKVNNAAITSTGAVSFMERFSRTTREVAQGGRRGALILTMDIRHPDSRQFALIKQDLSKVTGANISLLLSEDFMQAVDKDTDFNLRFPVDSDNIVDTVRARELWDVIVTSAHNTGEPGLIFWDHQHTYSPSSIYPNHKNKSTNPCGEIAMPAFDSCRLMVANLLRCVTNPFTSKASFDSEKFYEIVYEAQRLMDDVVQLEIEHIDKILKKIDNDPEPDQIKSVEREVWQLLRKQGLAGRRTGLGFTGLGDMLAALGLKFDSAKALKCVDAVMKVKCSAEWDSSIDMAIERGAFGEFDPKIEETSKFIQMLKSDLPEVYKRNKRYGRRNISISTVAPTGTVSLMTRTTAGIEPLYMLSYARNRKVNPSDVNVTVSYTDDLGDSWMKFEVYHPRIEDWMKATGKTDLEKSPYWGCTAPEIDWGKRIELQAIVQKYTTHSISSTVNIPSDVDVKEVEKIYMNAWKMGLKGITVYRDGCRGAGVLSKIEDEHSSIKRPKLVECDIHYSTIQGNKWILFVGKIDGKPHEIFGGKEENIQIAKKYKIGWIKKNGRDDRGIRIYDLYLGSMDDPDSQFVLKDLVSTFSPETGSYTRIVSTMLRHSVPIKFICEQLHKTSDQNDLYTFEKGIARVLKKYIKDGEMSGDTCSACGEKSLKYEEGCTTCANCGSSKCQ